MCSIKEVVVVLPFEPVIPIKRPSRKRSASSTFAPDGDTLCARGLQQGASAGTPDSERSGPVRKMNFPGGRPAPGLRPQSGVAQSLRRFRLPCAHPSPSRSSPARRRKERGGTPVLARSHDQHAACPQLKRIGIFAAIPFPAIATSTSSAQTAQKPARRSKTHDHFSIRSNRAIRNVMDGAIRKMRLPRNLNEPTCRITEQASNTKTPPDEEQQNLLFDDDRDHAERPAQESDPNISHENLRMGMQRCMTRESRATRRRAHRRTPSARPTFGDVLNVEVGRPAVVAADVCQYGEGACSDDVQPMARRPARQ